MGNGGEGTKGQHHQAGKRPHWQPCWAEQQPGSPPFRARARSISPTAAGARANTPPLHPTPRPQPQRALPAGTWSARAGVGTHAARPPRPPPAHSPNSCGRSLRRGGGAARRSL